jgi:hypothetical protein
MSATTTDAPSRAISRAVASPIPLPAPVTIPTFPSRRPIGRKYLKRQGHSRALAQARRSLRTIARIVGTDIFHAAALL